MGKRAITIAAAAAAIGWSLAIVPSVTHAAQPATQSPSEHSRIPVVPAADIVGKLISDRNGNEAGRIASLIIDSTNGKIKYVLIDGSQNFDLDGHLVAVPWLLMAPKPDARTIGINVTADELRHAPLINRSLVYPLVASNSQTRLYGYWGYPNGVDPHGYGDLGPGDPDLQGFSHADNGSASLPGSPEAQTKRSRRDRLTELEHQTDSHAEAQRKSDQRSGATSNQPRNGQQTRNDPVDSLTVDQSTVISALTSPTVTSISGLRSATVYSENGGLIGHIDQAVIDAKRGYIAYLRIRRHGSSQHNGSSHNGSSRHSPTLFALPLQALTWTRHEPGDYRLRVSERLLRNVPSLPADKKSRSTFVPTQQLTELYAHFGIVPYWQEQNATNNPQ